MTEREKVIKGLEWCMCEKHDCYREKGCPYENESDDVGCKYALHRDALALLKAQEPATVEPKRIELADETKAWLDTMDAVDALGNIADICIDWDGYRTADGLGGLVNEIWAYARYCADRLLKAHEPRVMTLEEVVALQEGKGDVWIEETAMPGIAPWIIAATLTEKTDWQELGTLWFSDDQCHYVTDYNLNTADGWRCWTSRPTDEQMEATPWKT